MSVEKVTPLPRVRGTPKRMRPMIVIVTYYIAALLGILHILLGLYLYYEAAVLSHPTSTLSLQPASLNSVIQVFSGVFAIISVFGLRRLEYWGALSTAVFGAFELWNALSLAEIIQIALNNLLGIILSAQQTGIITLLFQAFGILLIVIGGVSIWGVRRHRGVAALMKG